MNTKLFAIVKKIVAEKGVSILSEPKRISAFLADLAQEVPKPQKNALVKCLEQGFPQILKNASKTERVNCKQSLAKRLNEEEGLDLLLCEDSIGLLSAVLFGEEIVTTIAEGAFKDKQLTSFAIPSNVTNIGRFAFSNNRLINVIIPNSVTAIGNGAFSKNNLTSIIIPNSVKKIGEFAFFENQLTSVTINSGVINIGACAFSNNLLASITIPNGVVTIEHATFFENHLESVIIPKSVTAIDKNAFCRNILTSIKIGANVELGGSRKMESFDRGFDDFYKSHGRKAGTYIYGIGGWKVQ